MRAGLSIVNDSGSGAGPLSVIVSCSPGRRAAARRRTAASSAGGVRGIGRRGGEAAAEHHGHGDQQAAQRGWDGDITVHSHDLPAGHSFSAERGGALHVAAESVRNDFGHIDPRGFDRGDAAFVLAEVVARQHAVHEAVLRLAPGRSCGRPSRSVPTIFSVSSENCSRNSRLRLRVRAHAGASRSPRATRHERRTHAPARCRRSSRRASLPAAARRRPAVPAWLRR